MKFLYATILTMAIVVANESVIAQTSTRAAQNTTYPFTTVKGDELGVRTYTLKNGLTVMISVNKSEPRIQTVITTNAGSKNDPASHTGLAHYLEHMLFKGTDTFGSLSWETEAPLIAQITNLYEQYNHTTDVAERTKIYRSIDSVSGLAAKQAIPNEYDKMISAIGGQGSNAFTSVEQTSYVCDVPAGQLERWLMIEGERFRRPIFRLFHTELEAVYEEKNMSLDNDASKSFEQLNAGLFQRR